MQIAADATRHRLKPPVVITALRRSPHSWFSRFSPLLSFLSFPGFLPRSMSPVTGSVADRAVISDTLLGLKSADYRRIAVENSVMDGKTLGIHCFQMLEGAG